MASLSPTAKNEKQPKCPLIGKWLNKLSCIYKNGVLGMYWEWSEALKFIKKQGMHYRILSV